MLKSLLLRVFQSLIPQNRILNLKHGCFVTMGIGSGYIFSPRELLK